jgi:hypothetical protein
MFVCVGPSANVSGRTGTIPRNGGEVNALGCNPNRTDTLFREGREVMSHTAYDQSRWVPEHYAVVRAMASSQHTWTERFLRETEEEAADVYDQAERLTEIFRGGAGVGGIGRSSGGPHPRMLPGAGCTGGRPPPHSATLHCLRQHRRDSRWSRDGRGSMRKGWHPVPVKGCRYAEDPKRANLRFVGKLLGSGNVDGLTVQGGVGHGFC